MSLPTPLCSGFCPEISGDRRQISCEAETACSSRCQPPAIFPFSHRPLRRPGFGPLAGLLLSLSLFLSGISPALAVTLNNPGFESAFTGWVEIDPAAISTSDVYGGTSAAKITGLGGRIEQTVALSAYTDYRLTAWVFGPGTLGIDLGTTELTQSGTYNAYTQVAVDFNSGPATTTTIFATYNGGTGRFDDFALESLVTAPPPPAEGCSSLEPLTVAAVTASANDGNLPANTLDDNLGTRWSARGVGEWILFDLGEAVNIGEVDIAWYKGDQRSSDFEIETSSDGSTWSLVYAGTSSGGTIALETYAVTDTTARYLRVVVYGNTKNDWNSITEVDIYGCGQPAGGDEPPPPPPGSCSSLEAMNTMAVTASASDRNVPANTLDHNLGTRWSAQGAGEWIRFDLGETVEIDEVDIAWYKGNQRSADFEIETSPDGSNWLPVYAGYSTGSTEALETYDVTDSTARYLRIVGYGNTTNDWNSITEVEIYGCGQTDTGGGEPPPPPTQTPGDLDPNLPPGENFDLSTWKITFPDTSEQDQAWLVAGGESPNEFFTDPVTGGMVFRCPNLASSTSGSSYSRTELREMLRAGDTSISTHGVNGNNWVFSSSSSASQSMAGGVDGTLSATLTVDRVSTSGDAYKIGRVIIGQIHASDHEPIRLYYRKLPWNTKGSIYFAHDPAIGSEQWYEMIGSRSDNASDPADGIELGEKFSYVINVVGNTLTVTIRRDGKADVVLSIDISASGFADDWMYFKAGVYNQNNSGSDTEYAQATFYALSKTHD